MNRMRYVLLLATMVIATPSYSQESESEWVKADVEVQRLPPSAFTTLPSSIRQTLERAGFTIPQTYQDSTPQNVVHGHFRSMGQTDWAILCSKNRITSIVVFWGDR